MGRESGSHSSQPISVRRSRFFTMLWAKLMPVQPDGTSNETLGPLQYQAYRPGAKAPELRAGMEVGVDAIVGVGATVGATVGCPPELGVRGSRVYPAMATTTTAAAATASFE